jgi:mannose/cellobiose epimerase-like protein (N-acyl-D-glucosamine 2-epimerase family)
MNDNLEFYIKGKDLDSPHVFITDHEDGVWISLNRPGGSCYASFSKAEAQQMIEALTAITQAYEVTA